MFRSPIVRLLALICLALLPEIDALAASPQSAFTLSTFPTLNPLTDLQQDFHAANTLTPAGDGNYYGLLTYTFRTLQHEGGTSFYTTGYSAEAYKIGLNGTRTLIHTFSSPANNGGLDFYGVHACGALAAGKDGFFYGTTFFGGDNRAGQIFKMSVTGDVTVLHSFNGTDGFYPLGALAQGSDGNFYGTTTFGGGSSNKGNLYKITPGGIYTILHTFTGGSDGASPTAGVTLGPDGNFYGTTYNGGTSDYGTIYKLTAAGAYSTIFRFSKTNGAYPRATFVIGYDNALYGTTSTGGTTNEGTTYKITTGGAFTSLHSFKSSVDGASPGGMLTRAPDGNFYGTTPSSAFVMSAAGDVKTLVNFIGTNGGAIYSGLTLAANGNFLGTTSAGGANNGGTIFEIGQTTKLTKLYEFPGTQGNQPISLLLGKDGNFYGVTYNNAAGIGNGGVFKFAPSNNTLTNLATFIYSRSNTDLIQGTDGALYGTTLQTGVDGYGAGGVYKITTAGTATALHDFGGVNAGTTEGSTPFSGLIQATDGNFYGTTYQGGQYGGGTIYKITTAGVYTPLHQFTDDEGYAPQAALMQASDGNFYGVTGRGGVAANSGDGSVFKMTPAGVFTVLHKFDPAVERVQPLAALVEGKDGSLYGSTIDIYSLGSLFKITKAGVLTTVHNFTYTEGGPCRAPLLLAADGNFYGLMTTTATAGTGGVGAIFKLTPDGAVTIVYTFTGKDGAANPIGAGTEGLNARLVQGSDGYLYGVTERGGSSWTSDSSPGYGTIFKLDIGLSAHPLAALTISPGGVYGGQLAAGLVTISAPAPAGGQSVALYSSKTAAATIPKTVTIPAGQTSTTFTVSTLPGTAFSTVTITAISGGATQTAKVTVQVAQMKTLTLTPATVKGGVQNSTGIVTLTSPAPTGGTVVTLTSQAPWRASVPASVTVLAGKTTASFTATSKYVSSTATLAVTATAGGVSKIAGLTVTP